jgi:hypothetical protein
LQPCRVSLHAGVIVNSVGRSVCSNCVCGPPWDSRIECPPPFLGLPASPHASLPVCWADLVAQGRRESPEADMVASCVRMERGASKGHRTGSGLPEGERQWQRERANKRGRGRKGGSK